MPVVKGQRKVHGSRTADAPEMTAEKEAFCRGRAMGMSVDEAMVMGNISKSRSTVNDWLMEPTVKKRIAFLSSMATKNAIVATGLNREWVISRLMEVTQRCMQAEPVVAMVDGVMKETGQYKFDAAGANQALRMLGDTLGMFKPQDKKDDDDLSHLTDDELARLAQDLAAQTGLLPAPART